MRKLDVQHTDELSYDEFVRRYMAPNLPVIIRVCLILLNPRLTGTNGVVVRPRPQSDEVQDSSPSWVPLSFRPCDRWHLTLTLFRLSGLGRREVKQFLFI